MALVNTSVQKQKRGSLVAGIGGLVGIVSFLLLPYVNLTATVTNNNGFNNTQTNTVTVPVGTNFISILTGLIWVEGLLAIAIVVVAALGMLRDKPFGATATTAEMQIRRAAYVVLILGVAGIAFQFLFTTLGNSQINSLLQSISIGTFSVADLLARSNQSLSVSMGYAIGSWIYLIGMCVAIIGGVMMLRAGAPQTVSQPQSWQQFPAYQQNQQQGWQQPSQPQQGWQYPSQPLQPPQYPSQPQQGWQYPPQPQQPPTQGWQGPPTS